MAFTQPVRHNQQKEEEKLQKAMALEIARGYCASQGLSFEKLERQRFSIIYSTAIFAQPSDVIPNGLLNDLETQPKPTLLITVSGNGLNIEQTEHTRKYLAQ